MSSSKSSKLTKKALARERWDILRQAIVNKDRAVRSKASVRRFESFGFVNCEILEADDDEDDDSTDANFQWQLISVPSISKHCVKARFYKGPLTFEEMTGFDNTGNICLWPSEEIMTYFCLKNGIIFTDKSVCELGGGLTCLCALMISKICQPKEVFLTDGNESSFENLEAICNQNEFNCTVECCLLQWNRETSYGDLENRFDYIVCADCLFFDNFREDLCAVIYKLLKPNGTCLIFAPNRKNTFHKFVDLAKLNFECMIVHNYDDEIWALHQENKENNDAYEEEIHYPLLLKLCKKDSHSGFCKMVL